MNKTILYFFIGMDETRVRPRPMRNFMHFLNWLPILMVFLVVSGCSPKSISSPNHARQFDSAVIVVPGYYGTRLVRESDGSLVFISLNQ
ncbi:MAG: hypothetical protein KC594_16520, partial [Nitrospira sp.]|nr:hypothetical protein [Nitrospira sp.]